MSHEFEIHYELKELLPTMKRYWFSVSGWFFITTIGLLVMAFGFALFFRLDNLVAGFLGGALTILLMVLHWSYTSSIQQIAHRIARLDSPEVLLRLTAERFSIQRKSLLIEMDWCVIDRVLPYGDVWLLFERQTLFMMLPVELIDSEARQFILDKIKEHGGKIG